MAIISIPTSIGGVSIPGNLINGPLGALFGNKFGMSTYQYPRDLGSGTKGHVVQFSINEIQPITYEEAQSFIGGFDSVEGVVNQLNSVKDFFTGNSQKTLNFKPKKKRKVATISLYIPDTLNFQYNAGYGNLSLLEVANDVTSSAKDVPYVFRLYDKSGKVIAEREGVTDLIKSRTIAIFEGNVRATATPVRVSFELSPQIRWEKDSSKLSFTSLSSLL